MAREIQVPSWAWALFAIVVLLSLALDLFTHRNSHQGASRKQALLWSILWITVALLFAAFVGHQFGSAAFGEFLTAWLVEKSLSVDNLFVFLVIFQRLDIRNSAEQHRVLFWGILGAFVTRAIFIGAGAAVLARWHVATYVLGAFLIFTGIQTIRRHPNDEDGRESRILDWIRKRLPLAKPSPEPSGPRNEDGSPPRERHRFIVTEDGRRVVTPLFVALVVIELTDILFAVDSIPAVFAISRDPFIVFTSNVFAILGLRALYLLLADVVKDLEYLHYGLGALLAFVGLKMLASGVVHLPHWASLTITVAILTAAIVPSLVVRRRRHRAEQPAH